MWLEYRRPALFTVVRRDAPKVKLLPRHKYALGDHLFCFGVAGLGEHVAHHGLYCDRDGEEGVLHFVMRPGGIDEARATAALELRKTSLAQFRRGAGVDGEQRSARVNVCDYSGVQTFSPADALEPRMLNTGGP